MSNKSKQDLEKQSADYKALKALTESRGFQLVRKILEDEFAAALDQVSDPKSVKAEVEARGVIKFIKKFTETLNSELGFGEQAQKEYVKKYVNPPKDSQSE